MPHKSGTGPSVVYECLGIGCGIRRMVTGLEFLRILLGERPVPNCPRHDRKLAVVKIGRRRAFLRVDDVNSTLGSRIRRSSHLSDQGLASPDDADFGTYWGTPG